MILTGVIAQGGPVAPGAPVLSVTSITTNEYPIPNEPSEFQKVYAVSWTVPNNGGSAITGYRTEASYNSGSSWSTNGNHSAATTTATFSIDSNNSTPYIGRVLAINAVGSTSSNTINIVYP